MDYVTLLQKHAIEKENRPYLVLRDRKITYGQAYEDVRGFITPDWKKQFPAGYKTGVLTGVSGGNGCRTGACHRTL